MTEDNATDDSRLADTDWLEQLSVLALEAAVTRSHDVVTHMAALAEALYRGHQKLRPDDREAFRQAAGVPVQRA